MADYGFYSDVYKGSSVPQEDFTRLELRAKAELTRYKRIYTVSASNETDEDMALCAMVDALYYYETAINGGIITSSTIGSVSSSAQGNLIDITPKAQAKELYRCACLYLNIYRGSKNVNG